MLKVVNGRPDGHSQHIDAIEAKDHQNPKEGLVIPRPNAVIQKFTMMVEVRGASIALHAVMAILMHLRVADQAKLQLRHCVLYQFILVDDELVDWILGCEVDVVVDDDEEKDVVKA